METFIVDPRNESYNALNATWVPRRRTSAPTVMGHLGSGKRRARRSQRLPGAPTLSDLQLPHGMSSGQRRGGEARALLSSLEAPFWSILGDRDRTRREASLSSGNPTLLVQCKYAIVLVSRKFYIHFQSQKLTSKKMCAWLSPRYSRMMSKSWSLPSRTCLRWVILSDQNT